MCCRSAHKRNTLAVAVTEPQDSCMGLRAMAGSVMCMVLFGTGHAHAERKPHHPSVLTWEGPRAPWRARNIKHDSRSESHQGLIDLSTARAEPVAPSAPEAAKFATALAELCHFRPAHKRHAERWAPWIIEDAKRFGVDPFTVAALMYEQSRCRVDHELSGVGLGGIERGMHMRSVSEGSYHYHVYDGAQWQPTSLDISDHPFTFGGLKRARSGLYFTAALLRVARDQCPGMDGAHGSVPHRDPVSHVVWGDRVRGSDAEDRVLCARRRLIEAYHGPEREALGQFKSVALSSPLDGWPRKLTSVWGESRDGRDGKRKRRHRGIDFASYRGEPVRAVAAGTVVLAGVDLKIGKTPNYAPRAATKVRKRDMGPGGLLVKIAHDDGLTSAYMHLDRYYVSRGDRVERGQLLGRVGRSGVRRSHAHLHFELRDEGRRIDPVPYLGPLIITPDATWRGRRIAFYRRRARYKARRAARSAKPAASSQASSP